MTNVYVVAMGPTALQMAESLVWGCLAGVVRAEGVQLVTIGAQAEQLAQVLADYAVVRQRLARHGLTRPEVRLTQVDEAATSVNMRARDDADRLLCKALFTREEAGCDTAQDMSGCGPVAALCWAERLRENGMPQLDSLAAGDTVVLWGSLCDATCAAGAPALRAWLKAQRPMADVSGVYLLPVRTKDDAGLCREALRGMREQDYRALCLVGMPEDCRDEREGAAHLAHWMAVRCLDAVLEGAVGGHSVRVAADRLDWADFGMAQARYRRCYDGLMQAAWLMESEFGPTAIDKLNNPNWLRDRMGWYPAYFARARRMQAEERAMQIDLLTRAMRLMGAYAAWMAQVCEGMPSPMRWADSLEDAKEEAAAHYQQVIELAGRLALLEHDAEVGDMAHEHFVHRHDMSDSAAEATMRQIAEMKEELAALAKDQESLDERIGGRAMRSMLTGAIRRCSAEADELRAEAEEARRRIERAAQVATPEEMPRVEVARSKLERLERHLAVLDGRTARAQADLQLAMRDEIRTRAPQVTAEMQVQPTPPLYDVDTLTAMAALPDKDPKEQKKLASQLSQRWLWEGSARAAEDEIARAAADTDDPAGQLLTAMMMRTEGGREHAEGMDGRIGAPA